MTDNRQELVIELKKSQAQFAYFQLGGAASAIAYAVHETQGRSLHDTPVPMIVAVFLWALSFFFGSLGESARMRGLETNVAFLDFMRGIPAHLRKTPLTKDAHETARKDAARPVRLFQLQLWTLFAGAVLYIVGHGLQMAQTPSIPAPASPQGSDRKPTVSAANAASAATTGETGKTKGH